MGRRGTFYRKFPLLPNLIPSSSKTFDWWEAARREFVPAGVEEEARCFYCIAEGGNLPVFFCCGEQGRGDWRSRRICGVTGALCRPLSRVKGRLAPCRLSPPPAASCRYFMNWQEERDATLCEARCVVVKGGVGCSQHRVRTEPPRAGQSGQPARRAEPSGPPRGAGVVGPWPPDRTALQKLPGEPAAVGLSGKQAAAVGQGQLMPVRQRLCRAGHSDGAGFADPR